MFAAKDLIATKGGYKIAKSLRFRKSASANLTRTFSSPTSGTTWTWSGWIKRGALDATDQVFMSRYQDASNVSYFRWNDTNVLRFYDYSGGVLRTERSTNAVFRDPSAWYHVVVVYDSGNATPANRARIYVNGVEQTYASSTNPGLSQTSILNSSGAHQFGSYNSINYCDGYMADVNFIDGQALTPSSFGETNGTTGVWQPRGYTGTYGTNGFYLKFTDVGATSGSNSGYGKDFAGTNYWTTNNFGTTSTATTYDSMWDSPTAYDDGGNGVGNYCVANPLDKSANVTLSNANLTSSNASSTNGAVRASIGVSTGKWYWEVTVDSTDPMIGIANAAATLTDFPGVDANGWSYYGGTAKKYNNSVATNYGVTYTTGDVIGVALDLDNHTLEFYKNGSSQGTAFSSLAVNTYFPANGRGNGTAGVSYNFGQRPFKYTNYGTDRPASTFKALNTQNLAAGSITTSGSFTGNGSTDGPFVYLNGVPTAMTINGNAVTFATHADKLANGFKVRSSSASYNAAGSNTYSITTTGAKFKDANAQGNP